MATTSSTTVAHGPIEVDWLGGSEFEARRPGAPGVRIDGNAAWGLRIPVGEDGYVNFVRASDADPFAINVSVLADVLRRAIAARLVVAVAMPAGRADEGVREGFAAAGR